MRTLINFVVNLWPWSWGNVASRFVRSYNTKYYADVKSAKMIKTWYGWKIGRQE